MKFAEENNIPIPEFNPEYDNDFIYLNNILEELEIKFNILDENVEFYHGRKLLSLLLPPAMLCPLKKLNRNYLNELIISDVISSDVLSFT